MKTDDIWGCTPFFKFAVPVYLRGLFYFIKPPTEHNKRLEFIENNSECLEMFGEVWRGADHRSEKSEKNLPHG